MSAFYGPTQLALSSNEVQKFLATRYVAIAFCTLSTWETILHFPHDFRIFRKLLNRKRTAQITMIDAILIAIRYSLIANMISGMIFFFGRPDDCEATKHVLLISGIIGTASLMVLFLLRIYAMFSRNLFILAPLALLVALNVGFGLAADITAKVTSLKAFIPAPLPSCLAEGTGGVFGGLNSFDGQSLTRVIFDCLVLLLTAYRFWQLPDAKALGASNKVDMRRWILHSNIAYFVLIAGTYLSGFIGGRFVHDMSAVLIWGIIAQQLPLIIGVRLILFTPSRMEEARSRRQAYHPPAFRPPYSGSNSADSPSQSQNSRSDDPTNSSSHNRISFRRSSQFQSNNIAMTGLQPSPAVRSAPPLAQAFSSKSGDPTDEVMQTPGTEKDGVLDFNSISRSSTRGSGHIDFK